MGNFKESTYWAIWADCCKLHKSFYGIKEDDNAAWEAVLQESKRIRDKYKDSEMGKFAESLVLVVASELEHRSKSQKGGQENAETK